jgi:hypothetical protein
LAAFGYNSGGIGKALRSPFNESEFEVFSRRRSRKPRLHENVTIIKVEVEILPTRDDGYQRRWLSEPMRQIVRSRKALFAKREELGKEIRML